VLLAKKAFAMKNLGSNGDGVTIFYETPKGTFLADFTRFVPLRV